MKFLGKFLGLQLLIWWAILCFGLMALPLVLWRADEVITSTICSIGIEMIAVLMATIGFVVWGCHKADRVNKRPREEEYAPMTREEWVECVRRELIRRCEHVPDAQLSDEVKANYYGWACGVAEGFYGKCTPEEAVQKELTRGD